MHSNRQVGGTQVCLWHPGKRGAFTDARKRLVEAYDFCVELHDRWSDLETQAGEETANEAAEVSLKPYEDKQYAALTKLNEYIANNYPAQATSSRASSSIASAEAIPKLSTCKLLFPTQLTKSNTPGEFRLWIAAFRRFYDASNLHQQPISTQQGYLLQALDSSLQEILEHQLCPGTTIFGPAGCIDMLEAEFKSLYPIFNRRVDFFQVRRDQGEAIYGCALQNSEIWLTSRQYPMRISPYFGSSMPAMTHICVKKYSIWSAKMPRLSRRQLTSMRDSKRQKLPSARPHRSRHSARDPSTSHLHLLLKTNRLRPLPRKNSHRPNDVRVAGPTMPVTTVLCGKTGHHAVIVASRVTLQRFAHPLWEGNPKQSNQSWPYQTPLRIRTIHG